MQSLQQADKLDKLKINKQLIQSLYSEDEQSVIEQWIEQTPVKADHDDLTNANLVAEIALSTVHGELPQWAVYDQNHHAEWGRELKLLLLKKRDGLLNPMFLLMINWANSGPGFSWPESYYSTYLPGYNIHVVTASQDCDEMHGFTDEAIDFFVSDESDWIGKPEAWKNGPAAAIIKYWWAWSYEKWNQYPWAEIFQEGEISEPEAQSICDEVWGKDFIF